METATDLSVKPAQTSAPTVITAPQQGVLNMAGPMWIPHQLRPMQWPFPFPPNMIPPGQALPPPFMAGGPRQAPPPAVAPPPNSSPSPASTTPHSPDNDPAKRHKCSYCGKRFKLRHVLQQHELTHTNIKPYYCDICGFRARQKAVIWKHKKLKHGKEEHVPIRVSMDDGLGDLSVIEDEAAAMEEDLDASAIELSESPRTPSPKPPSPENLQALQVTPPPHNQVPIPESPSLFGNSPRHYICKICHKSFRNKHVLAQHELIHSSFRPYACDYCNFRAKQKAVIWRHIKVKHADMKEVSYRTESPPRTTEGTIIEPEPEPIKQEELSPIKPSIGQLAERKVHNVLDKLKSTIRGNRKKSYDLKTTLFSSSHQPPPTLVPLQQHSSPVTLTGFNFLKRFQCKTCNKMFKNKHILLQHELVHSNLRPYKCQFCGFRAKQKAVMWRHLKSRHPEKGRVRIIEEIDLKDIRESSAADFAKESNVMNNSLNATFDDDSDNKVVPEGVEEAMDLGNGEQEPEGEEDEEIEEDLDDLESDDDDTNEGDAYFCQTCGKGFNEKDAMEQHQRRHIKPLTCDKCAFRTRILENMEKHKQLKHTKKSSPPKPEPEVNSNFIPNPALLHTSTPQKVHVVRPEAPENLSIPQDLRQSTEDGKHKLFYCNMCNFCTRHQTSLSRHKRLKHDNEMREEVHSQGSSADGAEDETNRQAASEPGSPSVPPAHLMSFCLQQNPVSFPMFPNPTVMPIQMHLQNQQQQQQQLQQQAQVNGDPDKRYMCHVCGRGFKHRHVLHQHSLVHTDLKPYACEFCDFRGRQKASLWRHRQKHLAAMGKGYVPPNKDLFGPDDIFADSPDASPFTKQDGDSQGPVFPGGEDDDDDLPDDGLLLAEEYAEEGEEEAVSGGEDMEEFAEEVATENDKQEAHVVPTADGQYACSLCGNVLASKMSCQRHVLSHRTGKCYKCQVCGYQTAYSFALQRHIRIHTGERPYSCDKCDKTFKQSGSLLWHKRNHHNEAIEVPDNEECDDAVEANEPAVVEATA